MSHDYSKCSNLDTSNKLSSQQTITDNFPFWANYLDTLLFFLWHYQQCCLTVGQAGISHWERSSYSYLGSSIHFTPESIKRNHWDSKLFGCQDTIHQNSRVNGNRTKQNQPNKSRQQNSKKSQSYDRLWKHEKRSFTISYEVTIFGDESPQDLRQHELIT